MRKTTKILNFFVFLMLAGMVFSTVCAANYGDWYTEANDWWNKGSTSISVDSNVLSGIADLVDVVGTGVIAIATVVMGIKYMLGSTQGKVDVKENLPALIVACTFFFGWSQLRNLLILGNSTGVGGISGSSTKLVFFQGGDIASTMAQIFNLVLTVGKLIAVVVIAYNGVKYIFAGANAKAELKQKTPAMILGVILIFCSISFIQFMISTINDVL